MSSHDSLGHWMCWRRGGPFRRAGRPLRARGDAFTVRDNSRRSNETVHHHHVPVGAVLRLAHSDHDLVVFLEAGGVVDPENVLDDPQLVQWRGRAHQ